MIMKTNLVILCFFLAGCSLSPGMDMSYSTDSSGYGYVELDNEEKTKIFIESVDSNLLETLEARNSDYLIGQGDKLLITVWGLPEIFPINTFNAELNSRIVDEKGTIFFPYAGTLKAEGKTTRQLRNEITIEFEKFFNDPQIDVSILQYNSKKVYVLGEVTRPQKLVLTQTPMSLSDALGMVEGLNTQTSSGTEVFIFRQNEITGEPKIYRADLSSPSAFLIANNFYMESKDIIYVNASGTTKWNRVISQFFPFSSLLNNIDNLSN